MGDSEDDPKAEYDKLLGAVTQRAGETVGGGVGPVAVSGPYSFSSLLQSSSSSNPLDASDAVYTDLMAKEGRVLETVDRVVNHARFSAIKQRSFFQQPLHVFLTRLIDTCRHIMEDLIAASSMRGGYSATGRAIAHAFVDGERKMYLGVLLIIAGVVIVLVQTAF